MNWKEYFYGRFPQSVANYAAHAVKRPRCDYQEPPDRAVLVQTAPGTFPTFWSCWYMVAVIDNVVRFQLHDLYDKWQEQSPQYPIPMRETPMGYIARMNPNAMLIQSRPPPLLWHQFIAFMVLHIEERVCPLLGLRPGDFYNAMLSRREFGDPPNRYEDQLSAFLKDRCAVQAPLPEMNVVGLFLRDAVFYPCSGLDLAPIEFLARTFRRFFYADYSIDRVAFVNECSRRGVRGYRVSDVKDWDEWSVFGCSWADLADEHRDTTAKIKGDWSPSSAFVTEVDFSCSVPADGHGTHNFALLFARGEAIATFRSAFSRRGIAPRCIAHIRSGIGCGGNFYEFPQELDRAVRANRAGLPEFLLHDEMGGNRDGPDYLHLVADYSAIDQWTYQNATYGPAQLTLARRRGAGVESGCID